MFSNVQLDYLSHLLSKVGSVKLNGVKEHRHFKPPMWKERALRISFKSDSISDLEQALSEQSMVKLCLKKSFNGTIELPNSVLESLFFEKRQIAKKASLQSKNIVGVGEGRAIRECELIWSWIFETSANGILTVRIYMGKVYI